MRVLTLLFTAALFAFAMAAIVSPLWMFPNL